MKMRASAKRLRPAEILRQHAKPRPVELLRVHAVQMIELPSQAMTIVDRLLDTGLFGASRQEVLERLLLDKLREYIEPPRLKLS